MELLNSAIKFYNLSLNCCIFVFQSSEYTGQLIRTKHRTNMYLNDNIIEI